MINKRGSKFAAPPKKGTSFTTVEMTMMFQMSKKDATVDDYVAVLPNKSRKSIVEKLTRMQLVVRNAKG